MVDLNRLHSRSSSPLLSRNTNFKYNLSSPKVLSPNVSLLTNDDIEFCSSVRQQNVIRGLRRKSSDLIKERDKAIESVRNLHKQQRGLYDSFKLLREKYDDLKTELHHILWEFIPSQQVDDLSGFAELGQVNHAVFESSDRISSYLIGEILGEGQFSDVKLCIHGITGKQYAVKIIQKQKISTLSGLKRVRTEVKLLRQLHHPNIVTFVDYIHSPTSLYIFTEIGGKDLFEFFEANPLGADEKVAKEIILGIAKPLLYLHNCGICHRDLKPENVLLKMEENGQRVKHQNVRICDFGESAIATSKDGMNLCGLCGSPGFFAPEMIIGGDGRYNGFAADAWSVGCIMLELTRGHDEFCRLWMTSYDYDVLQEESVFEQSLCRAVQNIDSNNRNTEEKAMDKFLKNLLLIKPDLRLTASEMLQNAWLKSNCETEDGTSKENASSDLDATLENSDFMETIAVDKTPNLRAKRSIFRNSFSSRARKHFAGTNEKGDKVVLNDELIVSGGSPKSNETSTDHIEIKLPPIEPETPSFRMAKRTIMEGDKIVKTFQEMR